MSMNELASRLNITNGALTSHIKKLENCGLITTSSESAVHGNQKICSIHLDKILIDLEKPAEIENVYHTELKVGHYTNYQICPTCGLASADALIGEVDDPRYFEHQTAITLIFYGLHAVMLNMPFQILSRLPKNHTDHNFRRT